MAASANVRLRCSSWSQLVSIYRRDLARGRLFLKTKRPLAIGTVIGIKLLLPSGAAVDFSGRVSEHVGADHPRGAGLMVGVDELPTGDRLRLETAVRTAAEHADRKRDAEPPDRGAGSLSADQDAPLLDAEKELIAALRTELATYRVLNPFQILGVGYRADARSVHAAFADLSKRYHPDRFVRYQSAEISALAESLFVTARDAYRALATPALRSEALETIRAHRPAAREDSADQPSLDPLRAFPEVLGLLETEQFDDAVAVLTRACSDPDLGAAARLAVELVEALRALSSGDRLGAVERLSAVLERDPDNELAARELALLRQAHSTERQSVLARLISPGSNK